MKTTILCSSLMLTLSCLSPQPTKASSPVTAYDSYYVKDSNGVERRLKAICLSPQPNIGTVYFGGSDGCGWHFTFNGGHKNFRHWHVSMIWGQYAEDLDHGNMSWTLQSNEVQRYWGPPDPNNNNIVANGDRYAGYTWVGAESLLYNCFGYAVEDYRDYYDDSFYWFDQYPSVNMDTDYKNADLDDMRMGVGSDHAILEYAYEVQVPPGQYGPPYWVTVTYEKNNASGIYNRTWTAVSPSGPSAGAPNKKKYMTDP